MIYVIFQKLLVLYWQDLYHQKTMQPLIILLKMRGSAAVHCWTHKWQTIDFIWVITHSYSWIWLIEYNMTGRVQIVQELQLFWRQRMTVGKLPRLFCLVERNVLHLHAFAVWCDLCLCMVCVHTNLLLVLTLLVKQHQWKLVPKVLLSFGYISSLPLAVPPLAEQNSSLIRWGFAFVVLVL